MLSLVVRLLCLFAAAAGLGWLADRPGDIIVDWQGYEVKTTVFRALIMLALLIGTSIMLASVVRRIWQSPATIGNFFNKRRNKKGLESLSNGMIAIGAGDRTLATRYAIQARKALPNEPLTHLLRAQAAQLSGDRQTSRRIFEAMLTAPETEQLGLRGLYLEAERENASEAAEQFAERAVALNPKLGWSLDALFDMQCRKGDWAGALETVTLARKNGHIERPVADRRRAVLLAAQAQALEESEPNRSMALALEAHGIAPDLVPAAGIAGRMLAARGNTGRATKILSKTWRRSQHPDLATAYAYARLGDSPRDRLERTKQLAGLTPGSAEGAIAVATAAIDAKDWDLARRVLEPLQDDDKISQRICTLMARIEGGQHGDTGRVREWLGRAVHAPRDPAWTADGIVAEVWAPKSPVTGALDAFQWKVPVASLDKDSPALTARRDELAALVARPEPAPAAAPVAAADGNPRGSAAVKPAAAKAAVAADPLTEQFDIEAAAPRALGVKTGAAGSAAVAPTGRPVPQAAAAARTVGGVGRPGSPQAGPGAPSAKGSLTVSAASQRGMKPAVGAGAGGAQATAATAKLSAKPGLGRPEPQIYKPPHAPDDPGLEDGQTGSGNDQRRPQLQPHRTGR
jgi:HemY protein